MTDSRRLKVLIAAGGSGGHLFPAQQMSQQLKNQGECDIVFAGYKLSQSPFFAREEADRFVEIPAAPLSSLSFFPTLALGFWRSLKTIIAFKPDVVVGFGSYHVFPVLFAAACFRKKIVLFEANSSLGKVNRFFSKLVDCIAYQFPLSLPKGREVPFLPWLAKAKIWDQKEAKKAYGLDPEVLTFLVFGGSQGAQFLNEQAPSAIGLVSGEKQVIHCTGKPDLSVLGAYAKNGIKAYVASFESEMAKAYAAADVVICRSGASTIAELIRNHKPAVLIPFPKASEDHQRKNGEYLVQNNAARLLLQIEANPIRLAQEIKALMQELELKKLSLQKIDLHNMNRESLGDLVRNIGLGKSRKKR